MIIKLAITVAILIGVAQGASLATVAAEASNCTLQDGFKTVSCLKRVVDFSVKLDEMDMDDKTQVQEFLIICDSLYSCLTGDHCGVITDKGHEEIKGIKNYCDTVAYMTNDFAECSMKLEERNSTCYDEWDPYPDSVLDEKDPVKKAELNKKACDEYFGKNQCLKDDIIELCSEQEWYGFKDHLNEIRQLAYTVDIYDKESTDRINKPCDAFQKCHVALKCGVEGGVTVLIDKIVDYCAAISFHQTKEFENCDVKLAEWNSTCVQEWDPFPDPVEDPKKTEEMQKKACKNFFGKDNCLEKELSDFCGPEMWIEFKKHYLALNRINGACHFD